MRGIFVILLAGLWTISLHAQEAKHQFIGATACGMCHKGDKKGKQLEIWQGSKHAGAYATLATDKAKELAKAKGIENPQTDGACLKCHVAGFGEADNMFGEKFKKEEGVQCENCHGAGGDYKKMAVMKSKEESVKNGLIVASVADGSAEKLCRTCHNEESPSFKDFNFTERWAQIAHPRPKE